MSEGNEGKDEDLDSSMQLIDSWQLTASYYDILVLYYYWNPNYHSFFGGLRHHEVAKLLRTWVKLAFEDALIRDAAATAGVALGEAS